MEYKKRENQSYLGIAVFLIILIYLAVTFIISLTKETVSVCRVESGQIVNSAVFTGVCIRDEAVIPAKGNGYINFYVGEGDKTANSGNVYLLNSEAPTEKKENASETSNKNLDYSEMRDLVTVFTKNYSDNQFSQVYSLDNNMQSLSTEMISKSEIENYEASTSKGKIITSDSSGIVSYCYDGYEGLTVDAVTSKVLSDSAYESKEIDPYTYIQEGEPAYKLVYDHKWQIVVPLTQAQADALANTTSVNMIFTKDNIETIADFYIHQGTDGMYGVLTLNDYMVRYISERYIDVELVFTKISGLKIPTSALAKKDFYQIPIEYLIQDERSYETGFYCERTNENGEKVADFYTSGIYYQDENYFYVSMDDFEFGDSIGKVNSGASDERFRIGATGQLDGVYNINKGYTQFEIVRILHQNTDYCIVQENLSYSVAIYDNIVLNSQNVTENQIIY